MRAPSVPGPPGAAPPMAAPPMAAPPMAAPPQAAPPVAAPPPASSQVSPENAPSLGANDADLVGKKLNNRYFVEKHIGEGGFGDVYRAKQIQIGRDVAIKVLAPGMSQDENLVARFRREAQSACNLRDPHTIITYDFDTAENGLLYIAMELLQGETLFDLMERDTLIPANRVAGIMEQCCTSLGEAHSQGIVHRDIKPENIFLEARPDYPDFVKILDFGIAKIVAGDLAQGPQLTAAGQTLGTLEYMSPEQLMGKTLDGRSDVYALGIMSYQMLTGTLPFTSASPASIIQWHLKSVLQGASTLVPTVPADFDAILAKMTAKERDDRYGAVQELRADLQQLQGRHGWLAGSVSGPMTAVPAMQLPAAAPAAAPAAVQPYLGGQGGTQALMPTAAQPKSSNLLLIILIAVLVLGMAGFAIWFFAMRGGGDSGVSSGKDDKKGMSSAPSTMGVDRIRAEVMRQPPQRASPRATARKPPPGAPGGSAGLPAPSGPAVRAKPSLGGLLGVLGGARPAPGGGVKPVGGLGTLLSDDRGLPAAGRILKGRRSRAGLKAARKDPLRVIPPEMTLVGHVDLVAFRKPRWARRLVARVPAQVWSAFTAKLTSMGINPSKIDSISAGLTFQKGRDDDPIMLFVIAGKIRPKALLRAMRQEKGKVGTSRVAGYEVLTKKDLNVVVPSRKLAVFSSGEVLKSALSRLSRKRVKSVLGAGWGKAILKATGAKRTPHALLAMDLPKALQSKTAELLIKLKAGGAGDAILNFMLYAYAESDGLRLTMAATCTSTAVAAKLKLMLPLMLKLLGGQAPAALQPLLQAIRFDASGKVLALRLDLNEAQIDLLANLILAAA